MKNPEAAAAAEPPAATVLDATGARREHGEAEAAEDLAAIGSEQLEPETDREAETDGKGERKGSSSGKR